MKEYVALTDEVQAEINEYLNDLRESGRVNMFAAPSIIERLFGLSKLDAREAFFRWTATFDQD